MLIVEEKVCTIKRSDLFVVCVASMLILVCPSFKKILFPSRNPTGTCLQYLRTESLYISCPIWEAKKLKIEIQHNRLEISSQQYSWDLTISCKQIGLEKEVCQRKRNQSLWVRKIGRCPKWLWGSLEVVYYNGLKV